MSKQSTICIAILRLRYIDFPVVLREADAHGVLAFLGCRAFSVIPQGDRILSVQPDSVVKKRLIDSLITCELECRRFTAAPVKEHSKLCTGQPSATNVVHQRRYHRNLQVPNQFHTQSIIYMPTGKLLQQLGLHCWSSIDRGACSLGQVISTAYTVLYGSPCTGALTALLVWSPLSQRRGRSSTPLRGTTQFAITIRAQFTILAVVVTL